MGVLKYLATLYVSRRLASGAADYQIAVEIGLVPKHMKKLENPIRQQIKGALRSGAIKKGDTVYSIAKTLGVNQHYKVQFQINLMKRDGEW